MRHKMNIALVLCCLCMPLLASCDPGVGDGLLYNEWYRTGCPGFPSLAEVESVLAEHQELVQRLENISTDQVFVDIDGFDCPGGSYLFISYGGAATAWEILEILDEAGAREEGPRTFFGVPFLLNNN